MLVGANLTDKTIDVPPEIVRGTVKPLKLKPVAWIDSPEIFTAALPVFFIVTESVWLVPVVTDPKFAGDGLNDSVLGATTPWPFAATERASIRTAKNAWTTYRQGVCRGLW